jgi:aryl-alcohol dehydrogenase-like predicted oxidoreductase
MRFATARAVIDRSLDRGITFFDTADSYGSGWGERWLGRALGVRRREVIIATKCGLPTSIAGKFVKRALPDEGWISDLTAEGRNARFSPSYIRSALVGSLRRIGTEYIDILMLHNPPPDVLAAGDWAEVMSELKRSGLIHFTGVSARSAEDAAVAIREYNVDCIELELNANALPAAEETLELASEFGTAVIARQVFGSGSLLNLVAERLQSVCPAATKRKVAAALIRNVLDVPPISVAIVGMASLDHVEWNTSSSELSPRFVAQVGEIAREAG